jgi:hypothetical protein
MTANPDEVDIANVGMSETKASYVGHQCFKDGELHPKRRRRRGKSSGKVVRTVSRGRVAGACIHRWWAIQVDTSPLLERPTLPVHKKGEEKTSGRKRTIEEENVENVDVLMLMMMERENDFPMESFAVARFF